MSRASGWLTGLGLSVLAHAALIWPGAETHHAEAAFDPGLSAVHLTLAPALPSSTMSPAPDQPADTPQLNQSRIDPPAAIPLVATTMASAALPEQTMPPDAPDPTLAPTGPADQQTRTDNDSYPASREQDGRLEEKGVDTTAMIKGACRPVYPRLSRKLGEEGSVTLCADVQADGRARSVRLVRSSGYRGLDDAAIKALAGASFIPARRRGIGVASEREFEFTFMLKDPKP